VRVGGVNGAEDEVLQVGALPIYVVSHVATWGALYAQPVTIPAAVMFSYATWGGVMTFPRSFISSIIYGSEHNGLALFVCRH
jgi:hypothetical protein